MPEEAMRGNRSHGPAEGEEEHDQVQKSTGHPRWAAAGTATETPYGQDAGGTNAAARRAP